jgi:hypothetical protein
VLRPAVLVSIVAACGSCKASPSVDSIGYGAGTSVTPDRSPSRRVPPSPKAALGELVHAAVTVEGTLAASGGTVLLYAWHRLEAALAERAAAGHDVTAELAAAQQRCEDERAALDPGERDYVEAEYQSCEAMAGSLLLDDEQLTPECRALGVAWFDAGGRLLDAIEADGSCLRDIGSFEAYDVTPEPEDELLLLATFETLGLLTHGGFGRVQQATRLYVLAPRDGDEAELVQQLVIDLDVENDAGTCDNGLRRSVRIVEPGVLEVFAQAWDECERKDCVDPADVEDAAEDAFPVCQDEPVIADRTTWQPETRQWSEFEPLEHEGKVLPDGIMK